MSSVDHRQNNTDKEKSKTLRENPVKCYSVHHKSHTDWLTSEPRHLWWEVQD